MDDHQAFYNKVGDNIRAKRKERGLSQEGLAKAVGLKRPSLSNIEKGKQNVLLHTFYDVMETLDCSANSLLPERQSRLDPVNMPDLRAYSEEVRNFVEAGIKTAEKEASHGDSTAKN